MKAVELLGFESFWNNFFQIQCVFGLPTVAYKYGLVQMVLFLGQISYVLLKSHVCRCLMKNSSIKNTFFLLAVSKTSKDRVIGDHYHPWVPTSRV